jgi:hypothetical protein
LLCAWGTNAISEERMDFNYYLMLWLLFFHVETKGTFLSHLLSKNKPWVV